MLNFETSVIDVTEYEEDLPEGHFFVVKLGMEGLPEAVGKARSQPVASILAFENAAKLIREKMKEERNANADTSKV